MTNLYAIRTHSSGNYRVEKFSGQDWIVVPVVALVEGVIQGITASEPELALAEEYGKFPGAWNGRPVTIDHPFIQSGVDDTSVEADGELDSSSEPIRVSASSTPETLEDFQVGFIFNTQLSPGGKLKMEAWLDPEKMQAHSDASRELLRDIKAGEQVEVSTGLFAHSEHETGTYGGEKYFNVWRNVVPDHLALLPKGLVGACSIADGCGIYAQSKRGKVYETEFRVNRLHTQCSCGGTCNTCSEQTRQNKEKDKKPYGDVEYADPGHQSDGKSRYPVDTPEHIRAAWNYIHQEKNASKYTSSQLASIKRKIISAWKSKIDKKGPPSAKDNQAMAKNRQILSNSNLRANAPAVVGKTAGEEDAAPKTWSVTAFDYTDGAGFDDLGPQNQMSDEDWGIARLTTEAEGEGGQTISELMTADGDTRGGEGSTDDPPDPRTADPTGVSAYQAATLRHIARDPQGVLTRYNERVVRFNESQQNFANFIALLACPEGMMDGDARTLLQEAIDKAHPGESAYLMGFTPKHAIYSKYTPDTTNMYGGTRKTYRRSYNIDDTTKKAKLKNDMQQVRITSQITPDEEEENDEYTPRTDINDYAAHFVPVSLPTVSKKEIEMTTANAGKGGFGARSEDNIDDGGDGKAKDIDGTKKNAKSKDDNDADDKKDGKDGKDMKDSAARQQPVTAEQYLAAAPPELREVFASGLKMHSDRKVALVAQLKANKQNKFSEEQLKGMDLAMLENLAALAQPPADYSGMGGNFGSGDPLRTHAGETQPDPNSGFAPAPGLDAFRSNVTDLRKVEKPAA